MLRLIFAQTAPAGTYPPYVNFSGIVGDPAQDGIRISVRDDAVVEHTENGAHYTAGHTSSVIISKEQALELARSVLDHYGEEDDVHEHAIATGNIAAGLLKGQAEAPARGETGSKIHNTAPPPGGVVEAARPDGRNAPSPASVPLGRPTDGQGTFSDERDTSLGHQPVPVVAQNIVDRAAVPHLRDHELGGRDLGDEDPFDNIPF
jgi:hypothetical protein